MIEHGLLDAGAELTDARQRHRATVHADGTLAAETLAGPARGSIHKVGAAVQGISACNGWTFWHFRDPGRGLAPIDELRARLRQSIAS